MVNFLTLLLPVDQTKKSLSVIGQLAIVASNCREIHGRKSWPLIHTLLHSQS